MGTRRGRPRRCKRAGPWLQVVCYVVVTYESVFLHLATDDSPVAARGYFDRTRWAMSMVNAVVAAVVAVELSPETAPVAVIQIAVNWAVPAAVP